MTIIEIYNYEVKVLNESNDYKIEARVRIDNGNVQSISNGSIMKNDITLASFDNWGEHSLNFNVFNKENTVEVISEILAFIDEVKENNEILNLA